MSDKLNVLSLDCGGLFEIVSGQVLTRLERLLRRQTGNPRFRLADVFHVIAGTGIGGILGALYLSPNSLGRPRFCAEEVADFLIDHGDFIFDKAQLPIRHPGGARYTPVNLESMLSAYLGNLKLSQLIRACHLSAFDLLANRPHAFRSHRARNDESQDFPLTSVLRAISAMPDWFGRARIQHQNQEYLFCENGRYPSPPEAVLAEALLFFGRRPPQINLLSISLSKPTGPCGLCHLPPRPLRRTELMVRRLFPPGEHPGRYLRIAPHVPKHIDSCPDLATQQQLKWLGRFGDETAREYEEDLDQFARILMEAA